MTRSGTPENPHWFLAGGGSLGALMRTHAWGSTPFGDPASWSHSLRSALSNCINSPVVGALYWGADFRLLYNDSWLPFLGHRHPWALGRPMIDIWPDRWQAMTQPAQRVWQTGEGILLQNERLMLDRGAGEVETFWHYRFAPIHGEHGEILGVNVSGFDNTAQVLAERGKAGERERQQLMLRQMPGFAALLVGPEHRYEFVNDAYVALAGQRGFTGRTVREAFPELEGQGFFEVLDEVYASGKPYAARARPVQLDQVEGNRFVDLTYEPVRDAAGVVTGIFVGGYDVTERIEAEAELRASEGRLRMLADLSDQLGITNDPQGLAYVAAETLGRALNVSRVGYGTIDAATETLHVDRDWTAPGVESLAGSTPLRNYGSFIDSLKCGALIVIGDVREDARTSMAAGALEARAARSFVNVPLVEDGTLVAVLYVNHAQVRTWLPDELALIGEVAARTRDAVQRRRNEIALRESEARYRTLFDAIDEGFCIIEFFDGPHGPLSDYIHVQANAAYARHTGIPNVVGQTLREVVADEADAWAEIYGQVLKTGTPVRFERELLATGRYLELAAFRVEPASRRQVAVLFQDITTRKYTEAALRASEAQFRAFAQAMPNHVWAAHANGDLYWFNEQVYAFTGEEPGSLADTSWSRVVHPEDLPAAASTWAAALASGELYETEFRIRRHDGTYRWFLVRAEAVRAPDGIIVNWVGTNTDIHNARRQSAELANLNANLEEQVQARTRDLMAAEAALRQSQKMEAVGQLTGGLAHDFNNLLAGISGSLEMMQARISQGRIAEIDRYMIGAQGAAKRAAALTHRLLAFSRRQTLDPKPTDVNRLIAGMEEIVRRTAGPGVTVETVAQAGLWSTRVDPNQLENALLNLCINSRDAMPNGGRITIETANRWLDERTARDRELPPGQYISMCVSDNGTGMSAEVVEKAFDPFFTTKPIGVGTGLGLSMIYGFARQSGGQVRIYSEVGAGTMVCIYLPRYLGSELVETPSAAQTRLEPARTGETVLVIDDEALVRMLVVDVLEELGYVAIEAGDGPEGLKIVRSDARIDLLITDVGLPNGMNGKQVADAAREIRSGLKVLFITGYAENAALSHGHLGAGTQVVTKPFDMPMLANRIKAMISGAG